MVASIDVVLNTQLTTSAEIQITVLRDHKVLENLDYENSGHTGFASEGFVNNAINNALESKVDKVAGKTLTSNDFTIEYKDRVDNNKQNIESLATQLSLYQFTRLQIVSKFLEDYSSYVGSSVTVENYLNAPRLTYEFLRNHSNWSWLKQWIISCRSDFETNQAWLTNFLDGNETFWAYEMKAFLSETYQATYPGSTDYTIDAYANGWRPPSTIDELNSRVSALEANKVDRVEGKGLSTNDYDKTSKEIVDNLLNEEGQINSNLLPSYVDDVMEFTIQVSGSDFLNQIINQDIGSMVWIAASKTYTGDTYYRKFAINKDGTIEGLVIVEPESGKIYVGKSDTNTYRWSGSNLVEISKSIGLGETTTTAYAGNKGKNNALAIAELQARLPVPPTTQGTYKLNAIVDSNGFPTYVWSIE